MRIAVAGSGRLVVSVLRPLLESGHEVVAVLQNGRKLHGLRRRLLPFAARVFGGEQSVLRWARRRGIPVLWLDQQTEEELAHLRELSPDLLLVAGFSIILKRPVLELPRLGCVNVHSSLLPEHRGPNPFQAVILAGESESGVTYHGMDEGIDTGPIIEQTPFPVKEDDTMLAVYRRACDVAGSRVVAVMDRVADEGVVGQAQDPEDGSYDKKAAEQDSWIDWRRPAREVDRLVRALVPSPMPRFEHKGAVIRVLKVCCEEGAADASPGTVLAVRPKVRVACGEGSVVILGAFAKHPVPWTWPAPWNLPDRGEVLTSGDPWAETGDA